MQIFRLDTTRRALARRFVQFPFDLYRHSLYWVPPMRSDAWRQVNRKRNPFFLHSEADFFLAQNGQETVGRIAVLENRLYNQYHQKKCGFFYLFDAIDDQQAADGLFDAAIAWCRARGLERIIGPKGFSVFEGIGMLYRGFEYLPAMSMPYNYEYYNRLVEHIGLEKEVDFTSFCLDIRKFELPERVRRLADKVQERRGLQIKHFTSWDEVRQAVPGVIDAYNHTFTQNWEYAPVTPEDGAIAAAQMLQITRPEMVKVIVHEGKTVGFLLAFLNIGKPFKVHRVYRKIF